MENKQTQEEINTDILGQIDELNRKLQELSKPKETNKFRPYTDIKRYERLRVDNLYAGLPISDTSGTTGHFQAQIYLTKIGSTSSLCTLIDGVQKKVNLS
jgi:hypothetical protein